MRSINKLTLVGTVTALVLSTLIQSAMAGTKCYALALGSGDEASAYQAGVISSLASVLAPEEIAYSKVTGVSGSSVNALLLARTPIGQEK